MTPTVADLFSKYLREQTAAQAAGTGFAESGEEVSPYDAAPVQPVDPAPAWADALAVVKALGSPLSFATPPGWPQLVARQEPATAVAFALGNYPQLVRAVHPLLTAAEPASLRQTAGEQSLPEVQAWAAKAKAPADRLVAAACLRLLGRFAEAAQKLDGLEPSPFVVNERAALAWARGDDAEAVRLWESLPDGVARDMNLGMARLFTGDNGRAAESLDRALAVIPETNAWHHLAGLYRTMARG